MKKLLVFVLLFGTALALLRYFEGTGAPEDDGAPIADTPGAGEPGEGDPDETNPAADTDSTADPDERPIPGLALGGAQTISLFEADETDADIRWLVLKLDSENARTEPVPGVNSPGASGRPALRDVLLDATADVFEIGRPDAPQARLDADSIRFDRARDEESGETPEDDPGLGLEPDWVRVAELEQLVATLRSGAPFVPLTFRSATATLDARDPERRSLFAPGTIDVDSDELTATGEDLTVELDAGAFRFERAGRVRFVRPNGETLTLTSEGTLVVRRRTGRDPTQGSGVEIEAREGAMLRLEGDEASTLTARTVRMRGNEGAGGDGEFVLTHFEAEQDVLWIAGATEARGQRARLDFDANGDLSTWRVDDDPSLRFLLQDVQAIQDLEDPELPSDLPREGVVRISGVGPLTGRSGDARAFQMGGPALIELTQAALGDDPETTTTLRAAGSVSGSFDEEAERFTLGADGGVLLDAGTDGTLEAQALTAQLVRGEDGTDRIELETIGGAKLESVIEGRALSLVSGGRLRASRGEDWRIDEATEVTLNFEATEDEPAFRARAGRVTHFDPVRGDLDAEGGVQLQGEQGVGRGATVKVTGGERIELEGTPTAPATFEGVEGSAQALRIVREGNRTEARGEVVTRFVRVGGPRFATQDYEIRCDELDASQDRFVQGEDDELRSFSLEARGSVEGRVGFGDESSAIFCDLLIGDRQERWLRDASEVLQPFEATTVLQARGGIRGNLALQGSQVELTCLELDLTRAESLVPLEVDQDPEMSPFTVLAEARGEVAFELFTVRGSQPVQLRGNGEELRIDETLTGLLSPAPGGQVHLEGALPGQETPYELDASSIEFTGGERVDALDPWITVGLEGEEAGSISRFTARAAQMSATEELLRLEGGVELDTQTAAQAPWRVSADVVEIEGAAGGGAPQLDRLRAEGDIDILLGLSGESLGSSQVARAKAGRITGSSIAGTIRLEGFEDGRPATVRLPAMLTEAAWIEVDPEIQLIRRSGPGRMVPLDETVPGVPDWELRYAAAESFEDVEGEAYIFAIDQPYFDSRYVDGTLRSTVALFFFDKLGWQDLPARAAIARSEDSALRREALAEAPAPSTLPVARLLDVLRTRNLDGVLKEVYFEGPIEILRGDALVAHAEAIYADCVEGSAQIVGAQLNIFGADLEEDFEKLIVRTEFIRQTAEGILLADRATLTTSPFAEPNLTIETGDLRIVPSQSAEDESYKVYLRENRIQFRQSGISLPLPPIGFGTDDEYKPLWPTARFANSARFGTLLTLGFRRPLPKGLGDTVHDALGGDEDDPYDASFSADASYLSGRGALFDLGVDIEAAEDYELETLFGVVPDSGDDEGYIRVPQAGRDDPRLWLRAHSRFEFDDAEWLDIEGTYQTDAAVQSEFWEDEFERYEQEESYVQWRKGREETYYQATAKFGLESFRSTIEELPSLGAHFGRRPILEVGSTRLQWEGNAEAAFVRRSAGFSGVESPFSDTPILGANDEFADGLGDREVFRVDTRQRIEVPLTIGSVNATPFAEGRFTAWDEGQNPEATPTRLFASAGLRLSAQVWRRNAGGSFHQLAPFLELANSVVEERIGTPVQFDQVEAPLGGDRLDLGLRGRLGVEDGNSRFDFELRAQHRQDAPAGVTEGWQPLSVFARLNAEPWDRPVQLWHDGRYDLSDGSTPYALTALGVKANERLAFEVGHRAGRDLENQRLFEAAVISALYRWTEKWEFEGRQVYSLLRGNGLDAGLIVRRYGTDLVFEMEFRVREGEGSTVGVSFRPRFGFRASDIGSIGF